MSRRCSITGKGPKSGNTVSHSQKHTKRRWLPNVKKKKLMLNGRMVTVKLSMRALRTLEKKGLLK